jgi:hypothetical protein
MTDIELIADQMEDLAALREELDWSEVDTTPDTPEVEESSDPF